MRTDLIERYKALPLPTTRDEHWRFTDLKGFDPDAWTAEAAAPGKVPSLLDLDVAASATITESGIEVSDFSRTPNTLPEGVRFEALTDDHPLLGSLVKPDDKFRAHNAAVWEHGLLVHVPAGSSSKAALRARRELGAGWVALLARPRRGGAGSRFTVVQELTSADPELEAYANGVIEVVVHDGAKAEIVNVQRLSSKTWLFASCHARIERDAELDWVEGGFGSAKGKTWIQNDLADRGASSRVTGAYFADGSHISTTTRTSSTRRPTRRRTSRSRARFATRPRRCGAG